MVYRWLVLVIWLVKKLPMQDTGTAFAAAAAAAA